MKEFPGTHSPARGGRSSSTTPDFAGKERGARRGGMFSEEFLSPLRGSGETGNPSFPGAYFYFVRLARGPCFWVPQGCKVSSGRDLKFLGDTKSPPSPPQKM